MAPVPFRKLSFYAIITEQTLPDAQAINRHQPNTPTATIGDPG